MAKRQKAEKHIREILSENLFDNNEDGINDLKTICFGIHLLG
jgi:hypothetical protein